MYMYMYCTSIRRISTCRTLVAVAVSKVLRTSVSERGTELTRRSLTKSVRESPVESCRYLSSIKKSSPPAQDGGMGWIGGGSGAQVQRGYMSVPEKGRQASGGKVGEVCSPLSLQFPLPLRFPFPSPSPSLSFLSFLPFPPPSTPASTPLPLLFLAPCPLSQS